jgi:hypothetical protein
MDESYIAGFFDGEGSAMILTIKREMKTGTIFRFRPIIKISQKYRKALDCIQEHLGFGNVVMAPSSGVHEYVVNGLDGVMEFVDRIKPRSIIKKDVLSNIRELATFQKAHSRNVSYSLEDTLKMIKIRDRNFETNLLQRKGITQKYPKDVVLNDTTFVDDIEAWDKERHKNAYVAGLYAYSQSIKKPRDLMITCACGCGEEFPKYDNKGRERHYIRGHNNSRHGKVL